LSFFSSSLCDNVEHYGQLAADEIESYEPRFSSYRGHCVLWEVEIQARPLVGLPQAPVEPPFPRILPAFRAYVILCALKPLAAVVAQIIQKGKVLRRLLKAQV
jgi:hypothetical protein